MLIYWIMYLIPATFALIFTQKQKLVKILLAYTGFIFSLIIGFRYNIGSDWSQYYNHYIDVKEISFLEIFDRPGDYGHLIFNWIFAKLDLGIYGINFIYIIIFLIGLIKFCNKEQNPWIAMSVATPYLITVVAMGLIKQSVALGFVLLGINYLRDKKFINFSLLIICGALFHNSAIIMLSLLLLDKNIRIKTRILSIMLFSIILFIFLIQNFTSMYEIYIVRGLKSEGIYGRLILNLIPILFLFIFRKKWKKNYSDYNIWYWFSLITIISIFFIPISSTLIDRILIYFIPLQLVVYSRLPFLLKYIIQPIYTKLAIITFYGATHFIWLYFSNHSKAWLPYKNILFYD